MAPPIAMDTEEIVKGTVVYKMSASGNDFVMVDGRSSPVEDWTPQRIRDVCARRTGIGVDGVAVIAPGSVPGAIRFVYFNRDGDRAAMCGNASLCAAKLAARLELAPAEGMTLETDIGNIPARVLSGNGELAQIGFADVAGPTVPRIELGPGERSIHFVTVGCPSLGSGGRRPGSPVRRPRSAGQGPPIARVFGCRGCQRQLLGL